MIDQTSDLGRPRAAVEPLAGGFPPAGATGAGLRSYARPGKRIGEVIVDLGLARHEDVEDAVREARLSGRSTGQVLLQRGLVREDQLTHAIARRLGIEYVDLGEREIDMEAARLLGTDAAERYRAIPYAFAEDGSLLVAMAEPTNVIAIDDVALITGRRVRALAAYAPDVTTAIRRMDAPAELPEASVQRLATNAERSSPTDTRQDTRQDARVVEFVELVIAEGVEHGASDIHIEPRREDARILLRVDGVLRAVASLSSQLLPQIVSCVKVKAQLDIAERRVPQDGRFALSVKGRRIDMRVSTLPLVHGEGVVLRLLDPGVALRELHGIGFDAGQLERVQSAISRRHGAVLVTGPTGSGKSTTVYAALRSIAGGERSIVTIEDPVEYELADVRQMQVAGKVGVTFASGLRSILRSDPDVIMVGEIRDRETARAAVEAAVSGHLLISTLHTREAASALARLTDMGAESFLVAEAVDCVVAQRLVRALCVCKQPARLPESLLADRGLAGCLTYEAVGCMRCSGSGYSGRIGVHEVMSIDEEIRTLILQRATTARIAEAAARSGMRTLRESALEKVRLGETSLTEVDRAIAE